MFRELRRLKLKKKFQMVGFTARGSIMKMDVDKPYGIARATLMK